MKSARKRTASNLLSWRKWVCVAANALRLKHCLGQGTVTDEKQQLLSSFPFADQLTEVQIAEINVVFSHFNKGEGMAARWCQGVHLLQQMPPTTTGVELIGKTLAINFSFNSNLMLKAF